MPQYGGLGFEHLAPFVFQTPLVAQTEASRCHQIGNRQYGNYEEYQQGRDDVPVPLARDRGLFFGGWWQRAPLATYLGILRPYGIKIFIPSS